MTEIKQKIRCAIYTRKSTDEGLDKDFNSLDAQRASGENYIKSQEGEGWVCLEEYYDDGGYSGGNIDRPALQKLLSDIQENKIDTVVVYKVDRLSRSVTDFAKIMDIFEAHNISFVSTTQSFNTSNSVGKLMLNIVLSFAQYERELVGERTRDKIAASKKKGMWMGGTPPLGYDIGDRKLIVNEEESKVVKDIYDSFLKSQSVTEVARWMNGRGFTMKSWTSRKGNEYGGGKFHKNNIRDILKNPLYMGKVRHKDELYQGQHDGIVSEKIWNKVQEILQLRERPMVTSQRISTPALLGGLVRCKACDMKMTSTHTAKSHKRYRYYVCINSNKGSEDCPIGRLSVAEIEEIVIAKVLEILRKPEIMINSIKAGNVEGLTGADIALAFKNLEAVWDELFPAEQSRIINLLIEQVIVSEDGIDIRMFKDGLYSLVNEVKEDGFDEEN